MNHGNTTRLNSLIIIYSLFMMTRTLPTPYFIIVTGFNTSQMHACAVHGVSGQRGEEIACLPIALLFFCILGMMQFWSVVRVSDIKWLVWIAPELASELQWPALTRLGSSLVYLWKQSFTLNRKHAVWLVYTRLP